MTRPNAACHAAVLYSADATLYLRARKLHTTIQAVYYSFLAKHGEATIKFSAYIQRCFILSDIASAVLPAGLVFSRLPKVIYREVVFSDIAFSAHQLIALRALRHAKVIVLPKVIIQDYVARIWPYGQKHKIRIC